MLSRKNESDGQFKVNRQDLGGQFLGAAFKHLDLVCKLAHLVCLRKLLDPILFHIKKGELDSHFDTNYSHFCPLKVDL